MIFPSHKSSEDNHYVGHEQSIFPIVGKRRTCVDMGWVSSLTFLISMQLITKKRKDTTEVFCQYILNNRYKVSFD
jgi:hypothetical protein